MLALFFLVPSPTFRCTSHLVLLLPSPFSTLWHLIIFSIFPPCNGIVSIVIVVLFVKLTPSPFFQSRFYSVFRWERYYLKNDIKHLRVWACAIFICLSVILAVYLSFFGCLLVLYFLDQVLPLILFLFSRVLRDSTPRFVGPSVRPSVCPSVCPSVRHTSLFLVFAVFGLTAPTQMIWWPQLQPLPIRTRLG